MPSEQPAVDPEGGLAAEEDDVTVFEPQLLIPLDGSAQADSRELGGEGGRMVGDIHAPSLHDAIAGHQVSAGAGRTEWEGNGHQSQAGGGGQRQRKAYGVFDLLARCSSGAI